MIYASTHPPAIILATSIAQECAALPANAVAEIRAQDIVGLDTRREELVAFQAFMDLASSIPAHPAVVRAQVITQNYLCFVYLGDSCFKALQKHAPSGSATRKCYRFLTDNPIRAFRNALAHANWRYNEDFSGLRFWARKGSDPNEPLSDFEVSQLELGFWQALARCVSYVASPTQRTQPNESPESECSPGRSDQLHDGVCSIEQRQHRRHHEQEKSRGLGREVLMRFAREVIPAESMERRLPVAAVNLAQASQKTLGDPGIASD